jgi:hypothetical protein
MEADSALLNTFPFEAKAVLNENVEGALPLLSPRYHFTNVLGNSHRVFMKLPAGCEVSNKTLPGS